jgi:phosphoribosylamine--glycine ligase
VTGPVIEGLGGVPDDVLVFHAGTRRQGKKLLVSGGRVLNLVGTGPTLDQARDRAYRGVEAVRWPGMQFRPDIAGQS